MSTGVGPAPLESADSSRNWIPAIRVTEIRGVVIVAPQGVFDRATVDRLDRLLQAHGETPVVIDLSESTLADPTMLDRLAPHRWGRTVLSTCVSCSRATGRVLLSFARLSERVAIFHHVEDAIQAAVLADAGHGGGWSLLPANPRARLFHEVHDED